MHQLKIIIKRELKNFLSRNNGGGRKSLRTWVEWKGSQWTIRRFVLHLGDIFNETIIIIPLALVAHEMIMANSVLSASLAIISYPTCAHGIIAKLFYTE